MFTAWLGKDKPGLVEGGWLHNAKENGYECKT